MMKTIKNKKAFIMLHVLFLFYSIGIICSKNAAQQAFLSLPFFAYYLGMLVILVVYTLFWQQILKQLPLSVAYANKSVVMLWGIIWGALFFNESVTIGSIVGSIIVLSGVYLVVKDYE